MNTEKILKDLIDFKTISQTENNSLVNYIINYLEKFNIKSTVIPGNNNQSNLYARIGPDIHGGVFLSGHTDVVPVNGQNWLFNPFKATEKGNKIYGRGTADMKGFISVVLAMVPKIMKSKIKTPIHLMFSYDEEIGCVGIKKAIPFIKNMRNKPKYCIVGEPTNMKLINKHKGKKNLKVTFFGVESHSSLIENGLNAIDYAGTFIHFLRGIQKELQKKKYLDENFVPPFSTINIGKISGGIALNIIPKECQIEFEIRNLPSLNSENLIKKIKVHLDKLESEMKMKNKKSKIIFEIEDSFPGLATDENKSIVNIGLRALKSNKVSTVSFGTEAGLFQKLGIQTIVCGPGSIEQAHKANEYVKKDQLNKCEIFLDKVIKFLN